MYLVEATNRFNSPASSSPQHGSKKTRSIRHLQMPSNSVAALMQLRFPISEQNEDIMQTFTYIFVVSAIFYSSAYYFCFGQIDKTDAVKNISNLCTITPMKKKKKQAHH